MAVIVGTARVLIIFGVAVVVVVVAMVVAVVVVVVVFTLTLVTFQHLIPPAEVVCYLNGAVGRGGI